MNSFKYPRYLNGNEILVTRIKFCVKFSLLLFSYKLFVVQADHFYVSQTLIESFITMKSEI